MQAIVYDRYGSADQVLHLQEMDKPAVGGNEVRVRAEERTALRPVTRQRRQPVTRRISSGPGALRYLEQGHARG